ncbi:hypothetical protein K474DRAFT_816565 [Panus rudis PR-1116 ss-1]|nr:hypothetical protein K474DRAFT_816565 [Panus rudis PR-1116 ss-1]
MPRSITFTRTRQSAGPHQQSENNPHVAQPIVQYRAMQSFPHYSPSPVSQLTYVDYVQTSYPSRASVHNEYDEESDNRTDIGAEPSLQFARATWWDALLGLYASRGNHSQLALSSTVREATAQQIYSDLHFIFRESNFWFSFVNISRFFTRLHDPVQRQTVQPSLILALLALATFMQSSERDGGAKGRAWALRLRDEAQGALEASLSARWIDESLAHAAWVIAFFEISAHPRHSTDRVRSALSMLDSLIRSMSLMSLDQDDPRVTRFETRSVPVVSTPTSHTQSLPVNWDNHSHPHPHPQLGVGIPPPTSSCNCSSYTLVSHAPNAREITPMWLTTPAWADEHNEGEVRREECRRIVWSSMMLTAGHTMYISACSGFTPIDLYIHDPSNYAVLFPGEPVMAGSPQASKETVWALYARIMLLWHSCVRMRHAQDVSQDEKARFAVSAWLELDRIEAALGKHTCEIERSHLFQGREFMFNARMCISHEFRRYIPQATANANLLFHRQKAEEWLHHQTSVAEKATYGLQNITGTNLNLSRRPFFIFWFMSQMSRALTLWTCDRSLTIALDLCKTLMQPIEYLMSLWPCAEQRRRYQELREGLINACHVAGHPPPRPPSSSLSVDTSSSLL